MNREINLREMDSNQTGTIVKLVGPGEITRRIREMGLVPGTAVELVGRAPLADPVHLKVRDNHMALRNSEAESIRVTVSE